MDDLLAFLRAQLDEDERVARGASVGPWRTQRADSVYADETTIVLMPGPLPEWATLVVPPQCEGGEGIEPADAEHIARWDPARVLAEVKAKRAILDRCGHELRTFVGSSTQVTLAHLVVKQFAQPYAGRKGWREEWRA